MQIKCNKVQKYWYIFIHNYLLGKRNKYSFIIETLKLCDSHFQTTVFFSLRKYLKKCKLDLLNQKNIENMFTFSVNKYFFGYKKLYSFITKALITFSYHF